MREELCGEFDMVLTEVARDNPRSLKVHQSYSAPLQLIAGLNSLIFVALLSDYKTEPLLFLGPH